MRWFFRFLCIGALCATPVLGCGDAEPELGCRSAADCDDGNSCTSDRCWHDGHCRFLNRAEGSPCSGEPYSYCLLGGTHKCNSNGKCVCSF